MSFQISTNEALKIQWRQMIYYRQSIGRRGIKEIRSKTSLPNCNPDEPIDIIIINRHIPRGANFEWITPRKPKFDELAYSMHNAIKDEKVYSS